MCNFCAFFLSQYLFYEAEEVRRCLREGLKESPLFTHKETIMIAEMQEDINQKIGVTVFASKK